MVYTDNLFSENTNLRLSERRAKSVAEYFLSKPGIKKDQVQYVGMGSENPIADNTTPEGREKNNRVEFMINKKVF
jgi:outer membrane protein OmpA-like peptidoglycan-associated protein